MDQTNNSRKRRGTKLIKPQKKNIKNKIVQNTKKTKRKNDNAYNQEKKLNGKMYYSLL